MQRIFVKLRQFLKLVQLYKRIKFLQNHKRNAITKIRTYKQPIFTSSSLVKQLSPSLYFFSPCSETPQEDCCSEFFKFLQALAFSSVVTILSDLLITAPLRNIYIVNFYQKCLKITLISQRHL